MWNACRGRELRAQLSKVHDKDDEIRLLKEVVAEKDLQLVMLEEKGAEEASAEEVAWVNLGQGWSKLNRCNGGFGNGGKGRRHGREKQLTLFHLQTSAGT